MNPDLQIITAVKPDLQSTAVEEEEHWTPEAEGGGSRPEKTTPPLKKRRWWRRPLLVQIWHDLCLHAPIRPCDSGGGFEGRWWRWIGEENGGESERRWWWRC